jgi:hypothetical protein
MAKGIVMKVANCFTQKFPIESFDPKTAVSFFLFCLSTFNLKLMNFSRECGDRKGHDLFTHSVTAFAALYPNSIYPQAYACGYMLSPHSRLYIPVPALKARYI